MPEEDSQENDESNDKHALSPRLVDMIARSAKMVWTTTRKEEGLTGRSDVLLQTAVGMPVAVDNEGNICVVVMFSTHNIPKNENAVDYLINVSKSAASTSIPCLLPVCDTSNNSMETPHLSEHVFDPNLDNNLGEGVTANLISLDSAPHNTDLKAAPKDTFGIPMLPNFGDPETSADVFDEASYGIWNAIMDELGTMPLGPTDDSKKEAATETDMVKQTSDPELQVYFSSNATISEGRKTRLEEFLYAFLDMSVFDLADVWVPAGNDYPDSLRLVTCVSHDSGILDNFKDESTHTIIKFWSGAVGRAYSSGNPVMSGNPKVFVDPGRAGAFSESKITTVLAVPVYSEHHHNSVPECVVAIYSMVHSTSVPFVLRFVQQALRLLWNGLEHVEDRPGWQDVAPADLGEMAADFEMQEHFIKKKRPHTLISSTLEESDPFEPGIDVDDIRNHVYDALQSISEVMPVESVFTNEEGTKRAHVTPQPAGKPLPLPHSFPTHVVQRAEANVAQVTLHPPNGPVPVPASDPIRKVHPSSSTTYGSYAAMPQQPNVARMANTVDQYHVPTVYSSKSVVDTDSNAAPARAPPAAVANPSIQPQVATSNPAVMNYLDAGTCLPISMPDQKICRVQGCTNPAAPRRLHCARHSGNRECEHPGCTKCAQGTTPYCIAHGGGRRCTFPGCDKGARDKRFCAAHGGGRRCQHEGCTKSAVGRSSLCTAHGGGRRCTVAGCDKAAQSSTQFCVKHGGGKKCAREGCVKVARGRTQFCAAHGGGIRCKLEGCDRVAIGKQQLCRAHGGRSSRSKVPPVMPQQPPPQSVLPTSIEGLLNVSSI